LSVNIEKDTCVVNLILLIAEIWGLGGLVLILHYRSPRLGFAPLFMLIGCISTLLAGQYGVYIELWPEFIMFISSSVLVPSVLISVLILYVADGATPARMMIWSVGGITLLVIAIQLLYRLHLNLPGGGTFDLARADALFTDIDARVTIASLVAFVVDMFVIVVFYQGLKNTFSRIPQWIIVGVALLASLWADAIIFRLIADLGRDDFITLMPGDVMAKTISAVILWPLVAFYIVRVVPTMPGHIEGEQRPTFDLLVGSIEQIRTVLVGTKNELQKREAELSHERERVDLLRNFIDEASHDLKSPLTSINLKIYALSKTNDLDKRQAYLDELGLLSKRMTHMIDNLLTLAKLENPNQPPVAGLDINRVVREICETLYPIAEEKGINLAQDFNVIDKTLFLDEESLFHAVSNLIENAVRYTPPGGQVRVQTRAEGDQVVICVKDTGMGIPEEDQTKIFERFYRAPNARAETVGTGLGLAIVQKVIQRHKGHIEVASKVGQGTTFTVYLPFSLS
jgi:signal transduction histidine kinase